MPFTETNEQMIQTVPPKKVAIVGGHGSRRKAPFRDKTWDIWVFSSRRWRPPRITRWFEIHAMTDLKQQLAGKRPGRRSFRNYMRFMRKLKCPVYMMKVQRRIPNSVPFPFKELVNEYGRCFTSTLSYLIALAIHEGYDEIGLWGIRLKGKEYARQRPAVQYLLSLARQKGIKIRLKGGLRLRIPKKPKFPRTRVLYAYHWRSRHAWWRDRVRRAQKRRRRRRNR